MAKVYSHRFRIQLHDTDAAGVLFFGHLFRHAHDAYESFMSAIGAPLAAIVAGGDPGLPIVHAEAYYRAPMHHGEAIEVRVEVAEIRDRSFAVDYRFEKASGERCAIARTVHAVMGRDGARADLPEGLAASLAEYLKEAASF